MLYIIGVAHRAQVRRPGLEETDAQHTFTCYLDQTIQEIQPVFVAEEHSEEALAEGGETSIARQICTARGIGHAHRFCDPSPAERQAISCKDGQTLEWEIIMANAEGLSDDEIHLKARAIELARYFPIREQFWLGRMNGCRDHDAIFVCGNAHIETFTGRLDREGIRYRVVERGIGLTNEEREDFGRVVEYLRTHPDLQNE